MRGYTIEEVESWGVCYPRERLEELFAGRETLTARDCLDLEIPDEDKLFVLLRPEMIPERELHLLACDFAERVAHLTKNSWSSEAIRIKRLWVEGKATDEELAMAKRDAWASAEEVEWKASEWATHAARESAAWATTRAAAVAAARTAAWSAEAAGRVAAEAATRAAAAEAPCCSSVPVERKAQFDLVREVVERLDREEEQE